MMKDRSHRRALFASLAAGLLIVGCNASPASGERWDFHQRDGDPPPEDTATDVVPSDTTPDTSDTSLPSDAGTDATPGTWSGWYVHEPTEAYLIPNSQAVRQTIEPGSQRTCNFTFEPEEPTYSVAPNPPTRKFWRLRQPDSTRSPGSPVELSDRRLGYATVSGEKLPTTNDRRDARLAEASTSTQTCKTFQALGRCVAPRAGDFCYTGVELFSGITDSPDWDLQTSAGDLGSDDTTIEVSTTIDFAPQIADAGRDVYLQFDLPRFDTGRQDGRFQQDWDIAEEATGSIVRTCSSWGSVTRVHYPLDETTGWVHHIPAGERPGDQGVMIINLKTGVGQTTASAPPRGDTGTPPRPDCGTSPMALWLAAEYDAQP